MYMLSIIYSDKPYKTKGLKDVSLNITILFYSTYIKIFVTIPERVFIKVGLGLIVQYTIIKIR
jgi:hypothetical protein